MNKIWFFVEGTSEENCAKNIIWKNFPHIQILKDLSQFVETEGQAVCYIHDCGSVDKIPHEINKYNHLIPEDYSVIVLCDVERRICYTNRKNDIISRIDESIDYSEFNFVFSNTKIEDCYWFCEEQIKAVLKKVHSLKFQRDIANVNLDGYPRNQFGLERLFKNYMVKYRESIFSEYFFGRIQDFEECDEPTMRRLFSIITELNR